VERAELRIAGREWTIGDLTHLDTPAPFIAMMPQWDFLDFLRREAAAFPTFALELSEPVTGFIEEAGRVVGVRLQSGRELRSRLTIAADGRSSIARGILPL
jgi:2-polyprenyl-6-methoxyphenol hydroxylase-like FAD-dependent oxidoreductase